MRIFATKAIVQRLVNRFALSNTRFHPEDWSFAEQVVPVTNLDELLSVTLCQTIGPIDVTATGLLTLYTVPVGKRLNLRAARHSSGGGTWTANFWYAGSPAGDVDIPLKSYTAASLGTLLPLDLPGGIKLDESYILQVNIDSVAVAGTVYLDILGELEDVY